MSGYSIIDFFGNCSAFLLGEAGAELNGSEFEFLKAIGYLPEQTTKCVTKNQNALLSLAGQQLDVFQLPAPDSPGLFFFGCQLKTASFSLRQPQDLNLGVAGRGFSPRAAFESCMGEAAEFLSFHERISEPLIENRNFDCTSSQPHIMWSLGEIGISARSNAEAFDYIPVMRGVGEEVVKLPAEFIIRRPEPVRHGSKKSSTNGLGAGCTPKAGMYSGLMEVIERDAIACWWYGGSVARRVSNHTLQKLGLSQLEQKHRSSNAKKSWFLDLTSDLGIPVLACISSSESGSDISVGFGADLNWKTAAEKSFLEMCQMEIAQSLSLNRIQRLPSEQLNNTDRAWLAKHKALSLDSCPELNGEFVDDGIEIELQNSCLDAAISCLDRLGYEVLFANLTRCEVGVPVYRAIVPGLLPATPDKSCKRLIKLMEFNQIDLASLETRVAIV